jgi:hypothetical protein
MMFLTWHLIAIFTIMIGSFFMGYSLGKKHKLTNYSYIERFLDIFRR